MKAKTYKFYFIYLILIIWALFTLFPLFYMLYISFLIPSEIKTGSINLKFDFKKFTFYNYLELFKHSMIFKWFINSLLVCSIITLLQLFINSLSGYVLAKKKFLLNNFLFFSFVIVMMIPSQIVSIPLFILVSKLNLIDSFLAIILPALISPFGIFMMRQYMLSIPDELIDSAKIDGCNELNIFIKIVIPLSMPAFATLGIFIFITNWNAFLWPLLVLFSESKYTLSVGLSMLQGQHVIEYGLLMAGATISALPIIIVFIFFSNFIIKGISEGAIKG